MSSIIVWLSGIFTANRIAAIVAFLGALAAFITGLVGVFPAGWQNATLAIVGVLGKVIIVFKFLEGSQRYDALLMHHRIAALPSDSVELADQPTKLDPPKAAK